MPVKQPLGDVQERQPGSGRLWKAGLAALVSAALLSVQAAAQQADMRFAGACQRANRQITIVGVGDVLPHQPLQTQAATAGTYEPFWANVMPLLHQADIIYANLESPLAAGVNRSGQAVTDPGFAWDNNVYTGYPLFNANPHLAIDLAHSGFTIVSTANNHALDRGPLGVDRTIEALQAAGLPFTGTRHTGTDTPFYTVINQDGWNIAFIACTFFTNGLPDPNHQVLTCFDDRDFLLQQVSALAHNRSIDAVIVTPHWGDVENSQTVSPRNIELGHQLIDAGATAVIGTHVHVVQTWEKYTTADGREGVIAYSTGNFVSNQSDTYNHIGMAVFVGLSKDLFGRVWINGVRYHLFNVHRYPHRVESLTANDAGATTILSTLHGMLGTDRQLQPGQAVVTNPECSAGG